MIVLDLAGMLVKLIESIQVEKVWLRILFTTQLTDWRHGFNFYCPRLPQTFKQRQKIFEQTEIQGRFWKVKRVQPNVVEITILALG